MKDQTTRNSSALQWANAYRTTLAAMLEAICADADGALEKAIAAVAGALANDRLIHVAGSGHSHMLAEEVFYRAGGIAAAQAILEPDLMLHLGAQRSTAAEREEGRAEQVLVRHKVQAGDVVFVASNSGRNAYPIECAMAARARGATVIAITSQATAAAVASRHSSGKKLGDVAHIVIDNKAPVGDASLTIPGVGKMAPISTITGVFLLNTIMAEAAARVAAGGGRVDIYSSANGPDVSASPEQVARKWESRIDGLS